MEKTRFARLTGVIYVTAAIFGLIISLGGLIVLWTTRANVVKDVTGTTALVGRTLTATRDTIVVLDSSLLQAGTNLDMAQKMMDDVSGSLESSGGMIHSTADLVGNNLSDFVTNTRTSLDSVQTTANVVDNMLRTITGIPLIGPWLGGQRYNPAVPLGQSVANVSKSMEPLPGALATIRKDLDASATNVSTVKTEIDSLSKQVDGIRLSINEARRVTQEYRGVLNDTEIRYKQLEDRVPTTLTIIYILLTLLLVWVLLTQLGMLIHGLEMLGKL